MVVVRAHHSVFFVHAPVKQLDAPVGEARQEGIHGSIVGDHSRDRTVGIGLEVLSSRLEHMRLNEARTCSP